ncbi:beta strand repeat-containing protein [Bradyrhizobium sp. UFLA05-112]
MFYLLFRGRALRGSTALAFCAAAAASLLLMGSARAQFYTWGGTGSTTATSIYNLGSNWSNPPAGAPPVTNGQGAIFDATGSASIDVTSTVTPYSWTFTANSQSYSVSGADIKFDSGAYGIFNQANSGQVISISNNIGQLSLAQVWQLGASTLNLSGNNTYTGGTLISAGTVQVTNNNSVGTGAVRLNGGTFQTDGASDLTFTNGFIVTPNGGAVDNNGVVLTLSGVIANDSGFVATGALRLIDSSGGSGTTVLSGVNTYSGGTSVIGATVQVTNNSSVGSGTVTLQDALFQADGLSDLTFTNNFKIDNSASGSAIDANGVVLTIAGNVTDGNGAGKLTVLDSTFGNGVVTLLGTNTYTGGTTICVCASLVLGDATHTASIVGTVTNEGRFTFVNANNSGITALINDGGFTTFMGATSGSAMTITNTNVGAVAFLESSSAGSATINNQIGSVTLFGTHGGTDTATGGHRQDR